MNKHIIMIEGMGQKKMLVLLVLLVILVILLLLLLLIIIIILISIHHHETPILNGQVIQWFRIESPVSAHVFTSGSRAQQHVSPKSSESCCTFGQPAEKNGFSGPSCKHLLVVSTHLKNMLVKMDHFPNFRGEKIQK